MKATKFFALALAGLLAWGGVACSDSDDPAVVNEKTTLATPTPSASEVTASSFIVSWPAITGAGSYAYTINNGAENIVGVTSVKIDGLTASTAYNVKVKAVPSNTNDFEESAWGSVDVTTSASQGGGSTVESELEYTMSIGGAYYTFYGMHEWSDEIEAYNYVIDLYDFENMAILSLDIQSSTEEFVGTFPIDDTAAAGTAVIGVLTDEGYMYGTWFIPFNSDGSDYLYDKLAIIQDGSVQIKKNANGLYEVKAEVVGYHNLLEAETVEDLGITVVHAEYTGTIIEDTEEQSTASAKSVRPANYRRFAFANVNSVARDFAKKIR